MNKLEVKKDGTYVTSKDNTFFMQEKVNDNYFTKFRTNGSMDKENKIFG